MPGKSFTTKAQSFVNSFTAVGDRHTIYRLGKMKKLFLENYVG